MGRRRRGKPPVDDRFPSRRIRSGSTGSGSATVVEREDLCRLSRHGPRPGGVRRQRQRQRRTVAAGRRAEPAPVDALVLLAGPRPQRRYLLTGRPQRRRRHRRRLRRVGQRLRRGTAWIGQATGRRVSLVDDVRQAPQPGGRLLRCWYNYAQQQKNSHIIILFKPQLFFTTSHPLSALILLFRRQEEPAVPKGWFIRGFGLTNGIMGKVR